ncbi:sensor histidine kinase [Kibdelosporangium phytohabitans]|uniref:histidine kinase n=1 Tax=Kibdelosporangium phytohabitans TaxID=860235 RepID=A0A0N9HPS6_9PSEU|nr:ATP-binding protein [Kibdelosporangium phytohabitans]ALG06629.1 histidine kinase [Kibdelosporangium phytohabitans]MBE1467836.1 signal transduction histidine kinase [Kibdelosporangium phytohabitans]
MRKLKEAWFRRSIRFRIATMATAATLAILLGLAWLSGRGIGGLLISSTDRELRPILDAAITEVEAGRMPHPSTPYVQVRVLDTAGAPQDGLPGPGLEEWVIRELKGAEPVTQFDDEPPTRWIGTVVTAPNGAQRLVVAGTGLSGYEEAQRHGLNWLLIAGLLGAAATGIATWFSVRSSLRPVERMRLAAARLPAGQRLPLPDSHDELRSLAGALNGLLDRRDEATERLRRFTGDAAHELRSPVASIRVQAEVAVANPDPVLSQEVLADIVQESERLSTLVDGLLTLARSDAGELPTAQPVDLVTAAGAAISRCGSESPRVVLQAPIGSAWVLAAPAEVDLVLDNLLRNAVRYARAQVTVAVLPAGGLIRLVVDDDGPGVAPEHREKVFDRFYRVQDDRARQTGGSGLGLALVAELVRRRGGSVLVTESPDGGARFQVRWKSL